MAQPGVSQQSSHQSSKENVPSLMPCDKLAAELEPLGTSRQESGGTMLFRQGDAVTGAYLVLSGRVDLRLAVERSKRIVGRTAGPGTILGLPATISGEPYSLTATTLETCELVFIERQDVLTALRTHPARAMALLQTLAHEVHHLRDVWPGRPAKAAKHASRRPA